MKKNGFTLAETLVTIGIVGIVAAVTIPTLVNNTQKKVLANSLAATITNIENAFQGLILKENAKDYTETSLGKEDISDSSSYNVKEDFVNKLGIFTESIPASSGAEYYTGLTIYPINDKSKNVSTKSILHYAPFELKNSCAFLIESNTISWAEDKAIESGINFTQLVADIIIDVNGKQIPNMVGRDIFYFYLNERGKLIARGSYEGAVAEMLINENTNYNDYYWESQCSDTNKGDGSYCTGRLVEKDFIMDY